MVWNKSYKRKGIFKHALVRTDGRVVWQCFFKRIVAYTLNWLCEFGADFKSVVIFELSPDPEIIDNIWTKISDYAQILCIK
jgi:hypothetical protein